MNSTMDEIREIIQLKKKRNALILGHYYQSSEILDVTDFVGDSLDLARKSAENKHGIIVVAGVHFMAEITKLLNPNKTVLLPNQDATCEMADMVTAEDVRKLKEMHPGVPVVAYVNSSAAVKAEADICCTSRNVLGIVAALKTEEVIFVPDQNIASFVQLRTRKDITHLSGYCYVHKSITSLIVDIKRSEHPDAIVLVHPECDPDVLQRADIVASTGEMVEFISKAAEKEFIVGTEEGFIDALKKQFPEKLFYSPNQICRGMKTITLANIRNSLEHDCFEITLPEETIQRARNSIDRMLSI